jgi:uncharacterized protein involved in response to NO
MYSVISVTKVKNHSPKNSPVFYLLFVKVSRLARVLLAPGPAVRQRGVLSVAAATRETGGVFPFWKCWEWAEKRAFKCPLVFSLWFGEVLASRIVAEPADLANDRLS